MPGHGPGPAVSGGRATYADSPGEIPSTAVVDSRSMVVMELLRRKRMPRPYAQPRRPARRRSGTMPEMSAPAGSTPSRWDPDDGDGLRNFGYVIDGKLAGLAHPGYGG